jgi:hypothetical protein
MSNKRTNLDELVLLPDAEIEERMRAAAGRVESRVQRCYSENRDLTPRESELSQQDRDELAALKDATEIRAARRDEGDRIEAESRARGAQIAAAIEQRRGAQAFANGRQSFGAIETRAAVQVDPAAASAMGSPAGWAQTDARDPRHLIGFSGIPVQPLTGGTATVPQFTLPSGVAGVAETAEHAEYDSVVDVPLTAVRHGRWTKVTAAVDAFDPLTGLNNMHAIGIARDLDLAAVGDIETAAGTPVAYVADVAGNVRLALNTVAAGVYAEVSDLVIVGTPADIAVLQDVTPANGPDAGSVTARFSGARLYPSVAATSGQVTVFAPRAFATFMSGLQSASQINPADGSNTFGQWLHATGVAMGLVGGAVAVATVDGD